MIARLTPLKHNDLTEVDIIPANNLKDGFKGTYVSIYLEQNKYASGGLAVRVDCKGHKLGYLPELASVTAWKGEHHQWTKAVAAIRNQLFLEHDTNGTDRWGGHVAACRYHSAKGGTKLAWTPDMTEQCPITTHYKTYDELTVMPTEEQKGWKLEQCSIAFPVEEMESI